MNKVYIFGAGNNAYGVVSYIGCENVIAIIDNEKKKQGDRLLGIPIISLNEYVAKNNNEKNNTNVRFIESNLFENIQEQKFNIIVSNPPYIRSDVINKLSKQVQNEPHLALDGGEDGLKFYKKIIEQACNYIENGYLILEIGYDQKEDVENLLKENKNYSEIKTIQDLSGNDRCVIAKVGKI